MSPVVNTLNVVGAGTATGPVTVGFAFSNIATGTTDGALVTAVAGYRIRVLSARAVNGAIATSITFNSKPGGAGSAISETITLGANGVYTPALAPVGLFQTAVGEGLTATTSGAGSTIGTGITYCLVPA